MQVHYSSSELAENNGLHRPEISVRAPINFCTNYTRVCNGDHRLLAADLEAEAGVRISLPRKLFKALSTRIERMSLTDYIVMGPKTLIKV